MEISRDGQYLMFGPFTPRCPRCGRVVAHDPKAPKAGIYPCGVCGAVHERDARGWLVEHP